MITKEYLANYPYLKELIERDKEKLEKLKTNPPVNEVGKVYGSSKSFPYLPRGFYVSEPNIKDNKEWKEKVRALEVQLQSEIRLLEQIKCEIDMLIAKIINPRDKLVFEYLYHDGLTQQQVARKLFIDQSVVSRAIDKYIKK